MFAKIAGVFRSFTQVEHLVFGTAYIGDGLLGHENPWLLGAVSLTIGTAHVSHIKRTRKTATED